MSFAEITDALSRIAAGNIPGASALHLRGFNPGPTTSFETVWDNSNAYTFLAANMSSPTIVSSSASDTAAGTGARTVSITGVDSAYAIQTETLILNGTSTVALVNNYMSINSMSVATAGSGGVPAGNITIVAGGVTHGYILAGRNEAKSFIYTVPASYGLLMYDLFVSEEAASAGGNRAQILYSVNGGLNKIHDIAGTPTNFPLSQIFTVPIYYAEKTQLQLQFLSAAATGAVSAYSTCVLLNRTNTTDATSFAKWI